MKPTLASLQKQIDELRKQVELLMNERTGRLEARDASIRRNIGLGG